jgi:hypothetical protein
MVAAVTADGEALSAFACDVVHEFLSRKLPA